MIKVNPFGSTFTVVRFSKLARSCAYSEIEPSVRAEQTATILNQRFPNPSSRQLLKPS
jgi:hypothetical protein